MREDFGGAGIEIPMGMMILMLYRERESLGGTGTVSVCVSGRV